MRFTISTGRRIRYFRSLRNMTQKQLGVTVGLPKPSADIRIAQYEADVRKPKQAMIAALAGALAVSPAALLVPKIQDEVMLMHMMFALEDSIIELSDETKAAMLAALADWQCMTEKQKNGEISKAQYDEWRYRYPDGISFGM